MATKYEWKYTKSHAVMLNALSLKDLQRLYRLRSLQRDLVSFRESIACGARNKDHKEIGMLSRKRALLDRQRWAIEEVIKHKQSRLAIGTKVTTSKGGGTVIRYSELNDLYTVLLVGGKYEFVFYRRDLQVVK